MQRFIFDTIAKVLIRAKEIIAEKINPG